MNRNFSRRIILSVVLFFQLISLPAQVKTELLDDRDAWFWDFKDAGKFFRPQFIGNKSYIIYKDYEGLLETNGTASGTRVLTSTGGKGEIFDVVATEKFLYMLTRSKSTDAKLYHYRLFRIDPVTDQTIQVTDPASGKTVQFNREIEGGDMSYRLSAYKNRVIFVFFLEAGILPFKSLSVLHDEDPVPAVHYLVYETDMKLSGENLWKRIAVTNDKVYYYDSANYKVQIKEFRKTNGNNDRPDYYDFAGFDFAKNGIRILSLFDNTNGEAFMLGAYEKGADKGRHFVLQFKDRKAAVLAKFESNLDEVVVNNGTIYLFGYRRVVELKMDGTLQPVLSLQGENGLTPIGENRKMLLFQGARLFYGISADLGSMLRTEYWCHDLAANKDYKIATVDMESMYNDKVRERKWLHVAGDYFYFLEPKQAYYMLKRKNFITGAPEEEAVITSFDGTSASGNVGDIHQAGQVIFFWGNFTYKKKVKKKSKEFKNRVIGAVSLQG